MRKDILAVGIILTLFLLHGAYSKFVESFQKHDKVVQVDRKVKYLSHQLKVLKRLKNGNRNAQSPLLSADSIMREAPFWNCFFYSSFREKKEGSLKVVIGKLTCKVPSFSSVVKVLSFLDKYPVSITKLSYGKGEVLVLLKIYGE